MRNSTCAVLVSMALLFCLEHDKATALPVARPTEKKSIGNWVSCSGTSDDTAGVARAFAAARHGAFTLVVDCPVNVHSGLDIARVIYIDDGTTVEFSGAGKFTVDNVMHPAFVIANSSAINLTDWNVEYDASLPANPDVGGYANNGQFVPVAGRSQPSGPWSDVIMTAWLAANRGIVFDQSEGHAASRWIGTTNPCAIFFLTGDAFNISVTGMNVHVPAAAGADRFVPVVFQLSPNYKSNQTVTRKTPLTAQYYAVPHDLEFSNITFDGTYMGWVGNEQNVVFEHIRSHRYADLQDAKGENVGGVGKWFAPPHLFYLAYDRNKEDPSLYNRNIRIHDVVDDGPRVGTARDKGGADTISGYALSIKIGCNDCSVDTYTSTRPDGFMDVLYSDHLTVSNVEATYDSSFLNNAFPGWRFPSTDYTNLTFENISLKDLAQSSLQPPIAMSSRPVNDNVVFKNVRVTLNHWAGKGDLQPVAAGTNNVIVIDHSFSEDGSQLVTVQKGAMSHTLLATPATLKAGGATTLTWKSKQAASCSASGAWNGALESQGSRSVQLRAPGNYDFTMNCQGDSGSSSANVRVVAQPQ